MSLLSTRWSIPTRRRTLVKQAIPRWLLQHNDPDCRLTLHTKRHRGPWRLVHSQEFPTRAAAMRRERELKTGKGREWIRRLLRGC